MLVREEKSQCAQAKQPGIKSIQGEASSLVSYDHLLRQRDIWARLYGPREGGEICRPPEEIACCEESSSWTGAVFERGLFG
jgi:hypothetical protein